ncbi:MAG: patatin-like phospholipase RssA [Gammaproteobacteria bacterium]|nr:patatin-like phospholipase RssA [Gammaproteobacteria bacterium]
MKKFNNKIGLALGGGAARGWAHFGIIRALREQGIQPDIICGTSIGALVGASYVTNCMEDFEKWVLGLRKRDIAGMLDFTLGGGLIEGDRLMNFLRQDMSIDIPIEQLDIPFAAIATDLETGNEVWFQEGDLLDAVRASISLPGLFTPVCLKHKWLADGALVNPVPVSVCRALGAEQVIAVDLNAYIIGKSFRKEPAKNTQSKSSSISEITDNNLLKWIKNTLSSVINSDNKPNDEPGLFDVMNSAIIIMQDRITRTRMAGDPPDVLLRPNLSDIGMLDFHRAKEAIDKGMACVTRHIPSLDILE